MPWGADDRRTDQDLIESLVQGILTHSSPSLLLEYRRLSSYESGKIGVEELFGMLKNAGLDVSQERTNVLMTSCDRDGDDLMTKSDFVYLVSNNSTPTILPTTQMTTQQHESDAVVAADSYTSGDEESISEPTDISTNAPTGFDDASNANPTSEPDVNQAVVDDTSQGLVDDGQVVVDDNVDEMALSTHDISVIALFQDAMRSTGASTRNFFKKIDSDHTQFITSSQLKEGFNSLKVDVTVDQIDRIMYRFETEEKPGELKYFQFVKLLSIEL